MKFLSIKLIIICILMPSVLYVASLKFLESKLTEKYVKEIEDIYIGDATPLLNGSIGLSDAVRENVNRFLMGNRLLTWGVAIDITIKTEKGTMIYPPAFQVESVSLEPMDPSTVAVENFKLMNQGLTVSVNIQLGHNRLLSNLVLGFYILVFIGVLLIHYRLALKKTSHDERQKNGEIERLSKLKDQFKIQLKNLETDRETLIKQIDRSREEREGEKAKANQNEEELFNEMIALEERLEKNIILQNEQEKLVGKLKEEIEKLQKKTKSKDKQNRKDSENVKKRFSTLYKNIAIHDRATQGFVKLNGELRIKAEEIIHQLNENPDLVTIRRKVFGKKGMETIFEVDFAYKGRLYFRKWHDNRIEILLIGTKNSQEKDMEFLHTL